MSVTIEVGTTGKEINWSNANFQWVMRSLGIHYTPETEALLPSDIITRIQTFYARTSGYYSDPDLVARIYEYLAKPSDPLSDAVVNQLAGGGAKVVDASGIDWSNLGSIRDPNSDANRLWHDLRDHIRDLHVLAKTAQSQNDILRIY